MPRWPLLQPPTCVRGGWSSITFRITIEGRNLEDVQLGGWVYGPELGTAPAVLIVGGITASPFPFGDGQSEGDDPRAAWWPALCAPDLIDPAKYTVLCPSWPGNGSTWKGFDDPHSHESISVAGLADLVAAWLDGCGCTIPVTWVGASLGGMVGVRLRGAASRALREADHDLRRPASRRLGHGDAAPAARARARRPAQRRRRHRHDARAAARHADVSRPRRARHAVRQAAAASRSAAGRRVSRSSRPAIRRALSGQDVPAAERGDRSRVDGRCAGGARGVRARQRRNDRRRRARRHVVPVGAAGRAASRAAGRGRGFVAVEARIAVTDTMRFSPIRTSSPICCAARARSASR